MLLLVVPADASMTVVIVQKRYVDARICLNVASVAFDVVSFRPLPGAPHILVPGAQFPVRELWLPSSMFSAETKLIVASRTT
jgi:hypothetical protein